jgi:hypothetical protein
MFHSDCTILHSHQECPRVIISSRPLQRLLLPHSVKLLEENMQGNFMTLISIFLDLIIKAQTIRAKTDMALHET